MARWLSWLERRPVTAEVMGSSPIRVVGISSEILFSAMSIAYRGLSSAGRASALQAEGHRFEPYRPHIESPVPSGTGDSAYVGVVELADTQDLKSCGLNLPYGFDPRRRQE